MSRPVHLFIGSGLLIMLAACSQPPGLKAGPDIPPSNQPIELLPLDGLLAQANGATANDATAAALAARAARLRARLRDGVAAN